MQTFALPLAAPLPLLQVPRPAGEPRAAWTSCRGLAEERGQLGEGPGLAERWAGPERERERVEGFSPEIQTIRQSVLDRFRSSEVKKKSENIV